MLPIAANLPSSMFLPIVLLIAGYAALSVVANVARGREDRARAEKFSGYAFLLVLVAAAYGVVLLIASVVSYPSRVYDMVIIMLVIAVFFALLLFVFFVVAELLPRALRRGGDR